MEKRAMGKRITRLRYWLLGTLALVICLLAPPKIVPSQPMSVALAVNQTVSALETTAQQDYANGQYQAVVELLNQARDRYLIAGNTVRAAIAASNLSLSYQKLGDWEQADSALQQAWTLLTGKDLPKGILAQITDVQGQLYFSRGDLDAALDTWAQTDDLYGQLNNLERQALSRLHQAQALQAKGLFQQVSRTLETLRADLAAQPASPLKAATLRQLGDSFRSTGRLDEAEPVLKSSLSIARELADPTLTAAAHLSLGNLAQARLKKTFDRQQQAEALDQARVALAAYQAAIATVAQTDQLRARELAVQARLNLMQLLTNPPVADWNQALLFYPTVQESLAELPNSRIAVYGYTGLAENLVTLRSHLQDQHQAIALELQTQIADLLTTAQIQAEALADSYAQSLTEGTLGYFYEQMGQLDRAEMHSNAALALALEAQANDISYRWQWQRGRILRARGQCRLGGPADTADCEAAIAAYTAAFDTLRGLRSDLVTANPDVRFSFRRSVEPIYRDLVELLLASVPPLPTAQLKAESPNQLGNQQNQARLSQAREVMEALQVAQLANFFQAACIDEKINIDELVDEEQTAAVFYTILVKDYRGQDRLEVVLKLPKRSTSPAAKITDFEPVDLVHYYVIPTAEQTIDQTLQAFRAALVRGDDTRSYGQQLYGWLVKPAVEAGLFTSGLEETAIAAAASGQPPTVKNLIFALDGNLRLIPMATLYDGNRYLIEQYALSLIMGLSVREPQPLPQRENLQVLAAGLAEPVGADRQLYGPLPNVEEELAVIADAGLATTFLRNEAFTRRALQRQLTQTDYSIVHLATHGQFGRDRSDTYILVADNEASQRTAAPASLTSDTPLPQEPPEARIYIDTLGQVFPNRRQQETNLEVLVLSACKTATGDSREVLGIAGAAVQSGARSTIATLWSVDDVASVAFAQSLYFYLGQQTAAGTTMGRAEALRRTQLALLQQYPGRPRYWAPYVLVGSWR